MVIAFGSTNIYWMTLWSYKLLNQITSQNLCIIILSFCLNPRSVFKMCFERHRVLPEVWSCCSCGIVFQSQIYRTVLYLGDREVPWPTRCWTQTLTVKIRQPIRQTVCIPIDVWRKKNPKPFPVNLIKNNRWKPRVLWSGYDYESQNIFLF